MIPLAPIIILTFIESLGVVLVERGAFFYAKDVLGFSQAQNLLLGLGSGVVYVVGALASHRLARARGERRVLVALVLMQVVTHSIMVAFTTAGVLVVGKFVLSLTNGVKWPIVESYLSAGRSGGGAARAVGLFNVSWGATLPVALLMAGPMIGWHPWSLFAFAIVTNLASLAMMAAFLPAAPRHLAADHPQRPPAGELSRMRRMMRASRIAMVLSYVMLFLLVPLLPTIFMDRLHFPVQVATALAGVIDLFRVGAFTLLFLWTGWHGRRRFLVLVALTLPVGFFLILFGSTLAVVMAGALVFGLATGLAYFSSLYYAMVVQNASVDAGGDHEGLIGIGFTIGPIAGLIGLGLAGPLGSYTGAMLIGTVPVIAVCLGMSVWSLPRGEGSIG